MRYKERPLEVALFFEVAMLDSHAHLTDPRFQHDLDSVIRHAWDNNIRLIVLPGTTIEDSESARSICRSHPNCYWAAGVHPHNASSWNSTSSRVIERLVLESGVMGEVGLDFHYDFSPKTDQLIALNAQLQIAEDVGCPIIFHCRNAYDDLLKLLKYRSNLTYRGVIHCFTGTYRQALDFVRLGYFISFGGMLTFKKMHDLRSVASQLPVDTLLLETDSPYLAPEPLRGKRNEPGFIPYIYDSMAELRHCTRDDLVRVNRTNLNRAFGLGNPAPRGTICYRIRDTLYLNITNRCLNRCRFCIRNQSEYYFGWHLVLDHEPSIAEILAEIDVHSGYREVCFCGFGEPLLRAEIVLRTARELKRRGISVRINTSANVDSDNIQTLCEQLAAVVDHIEVSLGDHDLQSFREICNPVNDAGRAREQALEFIRNCLRFPGMKMTLSAVAAEGVDIEACRNLAVHLGAPFRVRQYQQPFGSTGSAEITSRTESGL